MDKMSGQLLAPPSLEELLERRGVHKSERFSDYQDFIEKKSESGLKTGLIRSPRVYAQGSMHLALGRTKSVKKFWTVGDKSG